jgi:4-hydroxy-3-methylbut-2-enyl diphosphate reductase
MLQPSMSDPRTTDTCPTRQDVLPAVRVLVANPRGFCAGVRRAIDAVTDALAVHGPPVYVRRAIVHNLEVIRGLEAQGAIFVQELDEVPDGAVVIFSAHGVPPGVARDARDRGLTAFDAVCPLVAKVHREVERHERMDRQVIIVGHAGHPEIEGTIGHLRGPVLVVNSTADVAALPLAPDAPAAFAVQTTYSVDDASQIVAALQARFSNLVGPATSDICYATTNRQAAVRDIAGQVDAFIVVGERFSSNATRLAELAESLCGSVQLVAGPEDVEWHQLRGACSIGISAAASTPERSVEAVLAALATRFSVQVDEVEAMHETTAFKRLAIA